MDNGWTWDMDCTPVHTALYELKQSSSLCDVCIVDDSGLAIMAHACVLAAGSPVLKNTLLLKQTATMLRRQGVSIRIGGISAQVWDFILQYLYLGKVFTPIDIQLIEKTYISAKILGISSLESVISINASQLGVSLLSGENVGTINVTLAPTIVNEQIDQAVQVNMSSVSVKTSVKQLPIVNTVKESISMQTTNMRMIPNQVIKVEPSPASLDIHAENMTLDVQSIGSCIIQKIVMLDDGDDSVEPDDDNFTGDFYETNKPINTAPQDHYSSQNIEQKEVNFGCNAILVCDNKVLPSPMLDPSVLSNINSANNSEQVNEQVNKQASEQVNNSNITVTSTSLLPTVNIHQVQFNRVRCRYCAMLFEKKTALIDHLLQTCSFLRRPVGSTKLNEIKLDYAIASSWKQCPNRNCGKVFKPCVEQLEYLNHIVECLMTKQCKLPVHDSQENDGCLLYLGSQVPMGTEDFLKASTVKESQKVLSKKYYKCGYCEYVDDKVQMCEHLAVVHGARRPYVCKICHVSVKSIDAFTQHYVAEHNENKSDRSVNSVKIKKELQLRSNDQNERVDSPQKKKVKVSSPDNEIASNDFSGPDNNISKGLCCPKEDCGERFSGDHQRYANHIVKCLMADSCRLPIEHVKEIGDSLVFDDGDRSTLASGELLSASKRKIRNLIHYQCSYCSMTGPKQRMAHHLAVVHGKRKPFICKECNSSYGYMDSLLDHYISHHTNQTFDCTSCDMTFNKKESLRRHVLTVHKREGKYIHECNVCKKKFKWSHHARRHERYHLGTDKRQYKCSECPKAFATRQDLDRHMDIHTGKKSFACTYCSFTSARKCNLLIHQRKHGVVYGEYVCMTCDKYFMSSSRFQAHISSKNHTGGHLSELASKEVAIDVDNVVEENKATDSKPVIQLSVMQCVPTAANSNNNPQNTGSDKEVTEITYVQVQQLPEVTAQDQAVITHLFEQEQVH